MLNSHLRYLIFTLILLASGVVHAQQPPDAGAPDGPFAKKLALIETLQKDVAELESDRTAAKGEERENIEERLAEKRDACHTNIVELAEALAAAKKAGESPAEEVLGKSRALLKQDWQRITRELAEVEKALGKSRDGAAAAKAAQDKLAHEAQVAAHNDRMAALLTSALENADRQQELGVDLVAELATLDKAIEKRARSVAALIEAAATDKQALTARPASSDDDKAARQSELDLAQKRLDAAAGTMRQLIDLMKARDLKSTEYQQLLIEKTGRLSKDVLDKDVTIGLLAKWLDRGEEWVASHAPQAAFGLLLFVLILAAAKLLARLLRRVVRRWVEKTAMSELAKDFVVSTTSRTVMAVGIIMGLSQLGIAMAPLLAGLGIAGFIIGFALQDTLSNFASGIMILAYQPFDVGDLVEVAGNRGVVDKMTLVSTSILTLDNQRLVVPNNKIWNDVIRNVTAEDTRRVDFLFGIGYGDDIDHAERVLRDIIADQEMLLDEPDSTVAVHELGDSSVNFVVRVWAKTEDYWNVHWAITAAVKRRFDAEGISIPFPQRDVHLFREAG